MRNRKVRRVYCRSRKLSEGGCAVAMEGLSKLESSIRSATCGDASHSSSAHRGLRKYSRLYKFRPRYPPFLRAVQILYAGAVLTPTLVQSRFLPHITSHLSLVFKFPVVPAPTYSNSRLFAPVFVLWLSQRQVQYGSDLEATEIQHQCPKQRSIDAAVAVSPGTEDVDHTF